MLQREGHAPTCPCPACGNVVPVLQPKRPVGRPRTRAPAPRSQAPPRKAEKRSTLMHRCRHCPEPASCHYPAHREAKGEARYLDGACYYCDTCPGYEPGTELVFRGQVGARKAKPSRNKELIAERLRGVPLQKLADRYHISKQRVSQITRRGGVPAHSEYVFKLWCKWPRKALRCVECGRWFGGKVKHAGHGLCARCNSKRRYHSDERYHRRHHELLKNMRERRKAKGLCTNCGKVPPRPGHSLCAACNARQMQHGRNYYRTHLGTGGKRRLQGLCVTCGKVPPRPGKVECQSCADKRSQHEKQRKEVLRARKAGTAPTG